MASTQRETETPRSERESTKEKEGKSGDVSKDALEKCSACGKKGQTLHCVHCGMLVCRTCRGTHVRDVMKELKESKEYLEAHYPKSVRERIALIQKVQKDLDLKNKKAEKAAEQAFKDLRKLVDEREADVKRKLKQAYMDKKRSLDIETAIFEGHLEENKQALNKVSSESCSSIHFAVGAMEDGQFASQCQTRKMYMYIIEKLHKPDEREEPTRTKIAVKYEQDLEDIKGPVGEFCTLTDDKPKDKEKKEKSDKSGGQNGDQHQTESDEGEKSNTQREQSQVN